MHADRTGTETLVMARYGELFLKSEPVKHHFIGMLLRNCKKALDAAGHSCRFETPRGRVLVHCDDPHAVAGILSRIFGIVDVNICTITTERPDEICTASVGLAQKKLRAGMSFAVRAKREKKTGMDSQELAALVGSAIFDNVPGIRVDLDTPDYELFVEVRDFGSLVYDTRIRGPGGLPWGTQGRVISLLSSGIDSPVASWLAMKRGCEVTHLYFDGGRWAGSDVTAAAVENHRRLSLWCAGNPFPMIIAPCESLYDRMDDLRIPPRFRCVICKRFMLVTAGRLMEREGALALVTGENLGQVASQTLANLAVISGAVTVPIIRPLITFDKEEAVALAREIGTFVKHPGDLACRAVPRMPATAAGPDEVVALEQKMGIDGLVGQALGGLRFVTALNGKVT